MMRTVCSSEVLVFSMFAPLKFLEITRFDLDSFLSIVIPIFIRFSMQSSCSVRVKVKENFHRNNPTLIPSKGKMKNFVFTLLKSEKSITSSEKSTVYSRNTYKLQSTWNRSGAECFGTRHVDTEVSTSI